MQNIIFLKRISEEYRKNRKFWPKAKNNKNRESSGSSASNSWWRTSLRWWFRRFHFDYVI